MSCDCGNCQVNPDDCPRGELQCELNAANNAITEIRGPDGLWHRCRDCGRRMVWQRPTVFDNLGSWMCPNCVLRRADAADARVREVEAENAALRASFSSGLKAANRLCSIYFDIAVAAVGEEDVRRQREELIEREDEVKP